MKSRSTLSHWFVFVMGFSIGVVVAPSTAHAISDYSSTLTRVARAAERIADTLEKAAR